MHFNPVARVLLVLVLCAAENLLAQQPNVGNDSKAQKQNVCTDLSRTEIVPCPGDHEDVHAAQPITAPSSPESKGEASKTSDQQSDGGAKAILSGQPAHDSSVSVVGQSSVLPAVSAGQPTGGSGVSLENEKASPLSLVRSFSSNVAYDQTRFWTSPLRLRLSDGYWGVPFSMVTGSLIAADASIEKELPSNPNTIQHAKDLSNYGAFAYAGITGGAYVWGKATHNDHLRETGLLAGEAAVNSLLVTEALKVAAGRQRPLEGNGRGEFWQGGQSFSSEHAAEAWSIATVFAHQYPGTITKLLAYGGATAISAGRVVGRQHFSSDVFVGSALGWYFAEQAVRRHEREQVDSRNWGAFVRAPQSSTAEGRRSNPAYMASPYVPIDSWVYPAFDRLIALGYTRTAVEDMRPWTRLECARIIGEVGQQLQLGDSEDRNSRAAAQIYVALAAEFAPELRRMGGGPNREIAPESIYTRTMGISGPVLNDDYHFGQTIINDYGRPDREGVNVITGFSGYGSADMFTGYFRGEYQHSPYASSMPDAARQVASAADHLPPEPALPFNAINRFRMIEGYVGTNLGGWQFTFGRQNLWWGPSGGGPMLFSDNAEPITMLRLSRVSPFKLPGVLSVLGPVRLEYFLGQLEGQSFIYGKTTGYEGQYGSTFSPQPFIHGTKVSCEFTPNLEFGISYTTLFSGKGVPFTTHTFLKSMFSTGNAVPGGPNDPGDRRSAIDFSYRLPGLRKWLTFYADGFADDQFSPIAYADRSAWRAGLYAPKLPALPKLDFRVEGVYTDLPIGGAVSRGFFYYNNRFRDGYTSDGNLLGNWIGRQGQGAQAWSTYWINPHSSVQFGFRHQKVSRQFIPDGGTLSDVSVRSNVWIRPDLSLSGFVQYERWLFPVIALGTQSNVGASFQISFWPKHWRR